MNEKPRQHHCEVVTGTLLDPEALAMKVEQAYQQINLTALQENMVILVTTQTTEAYHDEAGIACLAVIVTAQRIGRTDLEDAQRRAQLMGMHPPQAGRG